MQTCLHSRRFTRIKFLNSIQVKVEVRSAAVDPLGWACLLAALYLRPAAPRMSADVKSWFSRCRLRHSHPPTNERRAREAAIASVETVKRLVSLLNFALAESYHQIAPFLCLWQQLTTIQTKPTIKLTINPSSSVVLQVKLHIHRFRESAALGPDLSRHLRSRISD
jgi:hypothetical protein